MQSYLGPGRNGFTIYVRIRTPSARAFPFPFALAAPKQPGPTQLEVILDLVNVADDLSLSMCVCVCMYVCVCVRVWVSLSTLPLSLAVGGGEDHGIAGNTKDAMSLRFQAGTKTLQTQPHPTRDFQGRFQMDKSASREWVFTLAVKPAVFELHYAVWKSVNM